MDSEEKREILSRALVIQKEIDRLNASLKEIQQGSIHGMNYGERVQSSSIPISGGDIALELADEINEKEQDKQFEVEIIKRQLERQTGLSEREYKILSLRYVDCKELSEIKSLMGYSKRHCDRIINLGLQAIVL